MENPTPRTLAYLLAEPTHHETAYESVAGGYNAPSTRATSQQTLQVTGNSAQGPEINLDASLDY